VNVSILSGTKDFTVKAVRFLMIAMNVAVPFLAMVTTAVAILSPRIPPFFGYLLCRIGHDVEILGDPCQIGGVLSIRNLVSFKFIDMTNIFRILSGCICVAIYASGMLASHLMTTYEVLPSLVFQKDCLVQFQAEISQAKFSDYKKTMGKYRQLQLLNIMFNEIYSKKYFGVVMAAIIMILVPTGYFVVTSFHINQIMWISVFLITVVEYVIITTIFVMSSKIWNSSVNFRDAWRTNMRLSSRPLTRRYGASLQNLKIKIGSSNFVERNTPFVFVSFCVEQTISLVLLNNL
jgi:hypothetical protein